MCIIYDSELGITGEALINRFSELQEKMEYYADFPIRNYSLASPPKLKLTIREFTFGLVCNFVENDVHVIISLTTCTLAQLIEAQITPYRIPHIAIPRPACSREIINLSNVKMTTTTIWIQPTPEQTGRAIYEMSEIERASQALLLADKPNLCNFVENDVHVIISLTTCTLAQLIEAQITPYRIPHIAIPRPACSREIINLSNVKMTTTTIWIQPTPEQTGRAIYEMSEIERASQALLLADKPNLETNIALDYILQAEMNDEKFVPYISTQMFSITNQSNPMYPTSNTYDTIDVLLKSFQNMKSRSSSFLLSHIFHIQVRPLDLNQLYMIYQDRFTFRNLYWILPTTLTITPNELIRVATTNQFEQVATGFFRQFPILNEEDCLNLNERELEAVYMILLSSQATILMKSLSIDFWDIPSISDCDSPSFQPRPYGQLFYRLLISLAELPKWKNLLFYSLETDVEGKSKFLLTGNFSENGDIQLSEYAKFVAKQGLLSGLFPNTFRTFQNKTINVSTSFDPPYIVRGQITKDNELLNAEGLIIDILNEFSLRLQFRYRLFLPPDGEYGVKITNTTWNAAPLTINKERSQDLFFIGPFMEDTLGILLNIPEQNEELFQMFLPFRYDIWLCLIGSIFIAAFLITIFSIISPFSAWNLALPGATSDEVSIYHSVWFTVGGMLMQGQELRAIACSARTVTLLYWLLVLVIQATWQADLTAFLTRNTIQIPVSSLEDLATSGLSLGAIKNSGTVKMIQSATSNEYYSIVYEKIMKNPVILKNINDSIAYVRNSTKNVVLDDRIQLMHNLPDNEETLTVVDDKKVIVPFGFAVRLGEEYAPLMLNFMSILRERGVIDHLLEKWNVEKVKSTSNTATFNLITLYNISGAFIVLSVFVVTSLIVLIIEIKWHKYSLKKEKLHPKSKNSSDGHPSLLRRFTHPKDEIPKPKLDLSRNPTLKQLRYAGHRRASAAFDATVITAENQTESNLE
ncbi:glutamate receptor delta-1 subunit [Schistosoma bovis]|uniref:Glutamate receptor delta-1 subunit n=1 Tax=Schistosoma bovis TaxID=6184 RepID=A0A430Q6I3_SCHBO|nr:glutamate receptor delta-1 subunit [Schistosoma bovis]